MSWWQVFLLVFAMHQVSMYSTSIFLHRTLAHGSVSLKPWVATLNHFWLGLLVGISPLKWLAVHRKHHANTDCPGDPHSPHVAGFWHILLGSFFYYHREARNVATLAKYGAGYKPDFVDRHMWLRHYGFMGMAMCYLFFGWIGLVVWLLHFVLYVVTFSALNSLTHSVGERPDQKTKATNLRWLAWLTAGEGWHNNHHAAAGAPNFGSDTQFDPGWAAIRALIALGLAEIRNSRQT